MLELLEGDPILRGKDALNFLRKMEENLHKKADKAYVKRIWENAAKLEALMKTKENGNDWPFSDQS